MCGAGVDLSAGLSVLEVLIGPHVLGPSVDPSSSTFQVYIDDVLAYFRLSHLEAIDVSKSGTVQDLGFSLGSPLCATKRRLTLHLPLPFSPYSSCGSVRSCQMGRCRNDC